MTGANILRKRNVWLGLAWLWVAVVIYLSLTTISIPTVISWQDKAGHIGLYAILMWWFMQLYHKRHYWIIALGLLLLGAALEFGQSFHPMRHMDYHDMIANGAGVLLGWMTVHTPLSRALWNTERWWLGQDNQEETNG
ncbi:MAG: VanZ family protein [Proteobacteria bacterium]|nr:VanZ family protein [Pseudomonadota bacterium]